MEKRKKVASKVPLEEPAVPPKSTTNTSTKSTTKNKLPKNKSPDKVTFLVIGDIHFKYREIREGQEFIEKCIACIEKHRPTYVVFMGDTLDSHEVSRNGPFKLAEQLFERASVITKVIILIGNHDLINQHQFLTDAHFFGPYKRWPNITIVDKPSLIVVGKMNFAFCPYVDKGRLVEALETLKNDPTNSYDWVNATAIFGHSEVLGAIISPGKLSTKGDEWCSAYPIFIGGHLHEEQLIGENVFYPGSSRQVDSTESPDKRVWLVTFTDGVMKYDKLNLGLRWKKVIEMTPKDIGSLDPAEAEQYYLKVKMKCTHEQYKMFKKSVACTKWTAKGVVFTCDPPPSTTLASLGLKALTRQQTTFEGVLEKLLETKPLEVREAYERVTAAKRGEEQIEDEEEIDDEEEE